jgi:hypothetical protein
MKHPSQSRATAELSKSLSHQLTMYAFTASAAGVGFACISSCGRCESNL